MQPNMTHFVELKIDAVSQLHITYSLDSKLIKSAFLFRKIATKTLTNGVLNSLLWQYFSHNKEHDGVDIFFL